jgi:aminoglycoside phosphotransferase (APT) family kinase protein
MQLFLIGRRGSVAMNDDALYLKIQQLMDRSIGAPTNIEITNLELNHEGFSSEIAMFHLKYGRNGEEVLLDAVLKDYSKSHKVSSEAKYTKELAIITSSIVKLNLNVPKVYFADEATKVVLMEKVSGSTLDKALRNETSGFSKMIRLFGSSLARIHSLDIATMQKLISDDEDVNPRTHLFNYINLLRTRIMKFGELEYLEILDTLCERFEAVTFNDICFNHGDYHFLNVVLTESDELFVLDWENAKITDPRFDLARTLVHSTSWFGIHFREPFLAAYTSFTNKEIPHMDVFEALLSFDSFTKHLELFNGSDDSHIIDRSFMWLKRRYDYFVEKNGQRMQKAEAYFESKGF